VKELYKPLEEETKPLEEETKPAIEDWGDDLPF
jgi:hypothetical protein